MNSNAIRVITFDLDDTLWDIKPVLVNAEQQVYNWLKQNTPEVTAKFTLQGFIEWRWKIYQQQPKLAHQISQLRITAVQQALQEVGYSQKESAKMAGLAFDVFIDARHQVTLFDTVKPLLEKLQKDYTLGVLTNGNANIYKMDIGHYFNFAFSAEQLNASKPAPDHFLAAQQASNASAAQIVHIGDHIEHDVLAAQQAGCYDIWFNPDQQSVDDQVQPTQQVKCLSDIPKAIEAIENQLNP